MLASALQTEIALHLHDTSNGELTAAQLLTFINSAAMDYKNDGWLIRLEDDESLTITADTPEYTVPTSFAFIQDIWMERTINNVSHFDILIPRGHWTLRFNTGVARIFFMTQSALDTGKKLKVVGQKRPTIDYLAATTLDVGMESKLRERAISYALMSIGHGESELSMTRSRLAIIRRQLERPFPPRSFRMLPGSKLVPGRE